MRDYCKGREVIDGRTFEIEFWTELSWNLPYCRVSEITAKPFRVHWFSKKKVLREAKKVISVFWSCDNRLDIARENIKSYLKEEKDADEYRRQIEEFCNVGD